MTVYVHTTVDDEREAEKATQALLDAGFAARDIDIIERRGRTVGHARVDRRSRVLTGAGLGTAAGAILGSLAFSNPGVWFSDLPQLSISVGAGIGAVFGLVAGGITGVGFQRTVPSFHAHPQAIAVGVHAPKSRVASAAEALKRLGKEEVVAGTETDAIDRLIGTATRVHP